MLLSCWTPFKLQLTEGSLQVTKLTPCECYQPADLLQNSKALSRADNVCDNSQNSLALHNRRNVM